MKIESFVKQNGQNVFL
ncbi:hypothetical protein RB653_010667 [Dictyostelium firmibasis]|uniref:Uncharacterized protein n=1 Tax=Dictyostelium firmibasis TaxID=79012 RepID=A0AAN7YTU8_9MYCE